MSLDSLANRFIGLCRSHKNLPEYVKSAVMDDIVGEDLPDEAFADPVRRILPCHTKAAASLSYLDTLTSPERYQNASPEVWLKLAKSITAYGVRRDVEDMIATPTRPTEKVAHAFSQEIDGVLVQRLPMRNATEAWHACNYLFKHAARFTDDQKKAMAKNILDTGWVSGEGIITLEKMAGIEPVKVEEPTVDLPNGFSYKSAAFEALPIKTIEAVLGVETRQKLFPLGMKSASTIKSAAADLSAAEADELSRLLKTAGAQPTKAPTVKLSLQSLAA